MNHKLQMTRAEKNMTQLELANAVHASR